MAFFIGARLAGFGRADECVVGRPRQDAPRMNTRAIVDYELAHRPQTITKRTGQLNALLFVLAQMRLANQDEDFSGECAFCDKLFGVRCRSASLPIRGIRVIERLVAMCKMEKCDFSCRDIICDEEKRFFNVHFAQSTGENEDDGLVLSQYRWSIGAHNFYDGAEGDEGFSFDRTLPKLLKKSNHTQSCFLARIRIISALKQTKIASTAKSTAKEFICIALRSVTATRLIESEAHKRKLKDFVDNLTPEDIKPFVTKIAQKIVKITLNKSALTATKIRITHMKELQHNIDAPTVLPDTAYFQKTHRTCKKYATN